MSLIIAHRICFQSLLNIMALERLGGGLTWLMWKIHIAHYTENCSHPVDDQVTRGLGGLRHMICRDPQHVPSHSLEFMHVYVYDIERCRSASYTVPQFNAARSVNHLRLRRWRWGQHRVTQGTLVQPISRSTVEHHYTVDKSSRIEYDKRPIAGQ